jgi:two-component system OmpR family sensor kinase
MLRRSWFGLLLSCLLAAAGVLLLILVSQPQSTWLFPESAAVLSLILVLILVIFAVIFLLIRELLRRIWLAGAEQMRRKAVGEHQRFLKRLDHELKNPLTALRAGLASLTLTLKDEDQRRIVQTLADEAQRLSRLVADLRKLSELDALMLDLQPIQVNELCRNITNLVDDRCSALDRRVEMECGADDGKHALLIGDADLLVLVVHNLLDNAIKYTRQGDTITLGVTLEQQELGISIRDTGIGIPEEEQALVWEELYRGRNAAGIRGSGIGLALVKAIVERHNGRVELQSRLGVGTQVSFWLPLT